MDAFFVYLILAIGLFLAVFITKKRFGLLGLALSAGSILSATWSDYAESIFTRAGFSSGPFTGVFITMILVLTPSIVLIFHGSKHKNLVGRLTGSIMFSVLALAFLVEPLSHMLVPQSVGVEVYNMLFNNRTMIIGVGLIIAVIDLFFTKPASSTEKKPKH